jgi:hypothetical protein
MYRLLSKTRSSSALSDIKDESEARVFYISLVENRLKVTAHVLTSIVLKRKSLIHIQGVQKNPKRLKYRIVRI